MLFKNFVKIQTSVDSNEKAKSYENTHNCFFFIRLAISAIILAAYQLTGASEELANALRLTFNGNWIVVNAIYVAVSVFGYLAIMFPLTYYTEYLIEHHYGMSNLDFSEWLSDFIKSLIIDLILCTIFFSIIYAILRYAPENWWIGATAFYVLFVVALSAIFPTLIMPLFNNFTPLENKELTEKVTAMMKSAGITVVGIYKWGLEEKTNAGNAAFTGLGKSRRIILGDTLLKDYSEEQILSILAHEVGHYKNRDTARLLVVGTILAGVGFFIAKIVLDLLVLKLGFESISDIATLPLFIFALLIFSITTMPISNGYSRKREYAADKYAVEEMGNSEGLTSALEKLADQNLSDKNPNRLTEILLHSHPSLKRRIAAAQNFEKSNKNK